MIVTKMGLQMAASELPEEERGGFNWLRLAGREERL